MITLLVGYYRDPVANRAQEMTTCLARNAENAHISEVHVFIEEAGALPPVDHPKIRVVPHGRRLLFADFFDWANRNLVGKTVAVANADIYFDDSLALLKSVKLRRRLLCLSRWDVHADGSSHLRERDDSQDAWIFKAPIRSFRSDYHLGQPGCDNRLAWEAKKAGLRVSNPSRSVRAHHLHVSRVRRAQQQLTGPMLLVPPTYLD